MAKACSFEEMPSNPIAKKVSARGGAPNSFVKGPSGKSGKKGGKKVTTK